MTTAKSSFSFQRFWPVYRNLLRRNRGTALFYGVLGFLFFGVQYLLTLLDYLKYGQHNIYRFEVIGPAGVYNGFAVVFFTMMSLVVPIIVATNLFSYMQNKRSVDVYHALPLTRSELYLSTAAAGVTLIWIPLILNFLFVGVCSFWAPKQNLSMIGLELLCWMAISFVLFAITAFAAVNVGTTFDTAVFSLGLNASIASVYLVVVAVSGIFLYGFYDGDMFVRVAYRLSPVSLMVGRQAIGYSTTDYLVENNIAIGIWLALGLVIFAGGMLVYKRRKSEQAESVGNLGPLQIFLRSIGTLVGGSGLGAIFCAVLGFGSSKPVYLVAVAVGSMIVYFIGDVFLTRTVRSIPKALPAALVTTLVVCGLVGGIMYGGFGFEKRVPAANTVAQVTLSSYQSRFSSNPALDGKYSHDYTFVSPEAIEIITSAHAAQITAHFDGGNFETSSRYGGSFRVNYILKNGQELARGYYDLYDEALQALIALEVQPELIKQSHAVFRARADMIDSVSVTNALGLSTKQLVLNDAQKQQLLEAIRTDLLAQPLEELKNGTQALGYLNITYKYLNEFTIERPFAIEEANNLNPEYSMAVGEVLITESYSNTRNLLKAWGAEEQLKNDFTMVEKAYVGVTGYKFFYRGAVLYQTSLEERDYLSDMVLDSYYESTMDKAVGNTNAYVELSGTQLTAIRKDLTNIYAAKNNEPLVVVAIVDVSGSKESISSYYFMPFKALSESMKQQVLERAQYEYSEYTLADMGYTI